PTDEDANVVQFEEEINAALRELGIGWQIRDGVIQARGDDAFEKVVSTAKDALQAADKTTAHNELLEALKDISRRPEPDSTGAIPGRSGRWQQWGVPDGNDGTVAPSRSRRGTEEAVVPARTARRR